MRLLYWLASEENWLVSVPQKLAQHPEHSGSVGQIANKGYIKTLVDNDEDIQRVLNWDADTQILSIQDPQYLFYIKNILWSKFPFQIGYRAVSFPPPSGRKYDIALSFAGSDRDTAAELFDALTSRDLDVFFDTNEESRMLAESVEDYLAPIYESESTYVVVLLGAEFPKPVWTKFESDHFVTRFGEHAVIPIWFSDAPPQMFDMTRQVGGLTFDRTIDAAAQLSQFADVIERKLEETALLAPDEREARAETDEPPVRQIID